MSRNDVHRFQVWNRKPPLRASTPSLYLFNGENPEVDSEACMVFGGIRWKKPKSLNYHIELPYEF